MSMAGTTESESVSSSVDQDLLRQVLGNSTDPLVLAALAQLQGADASESKDEKNTKKRKGDEGDEDDKDSK